MINFIFGAFAGGFIMLALLQLVTKKTINFAGISEKSDNIDRYWSFVLAYLAGFLGILVLYFVYDKL